MKTQPIISVQEANSWLTPSFAIGLLLFLNCFFGTYNRSVDSVNIDFFTWWAVPHGISRQYIEIPYSDENRKKLAEKIKNEIRTTKSPNVEEETLQTVLTFYDDRIISTASPFFYAFINGFVSNDYQLDKRKFITVSLLCFTVAVFMVGRLLSFSPLTLFIFYALITMWFSPYLSETKVGNINQIQLFLISIFIVLSARTKGFANFLWAAFFLGISIFLKPITCFILLFAFISALFNKDIKRVSAYCAGICLSGILAFLGTAWYFKSLHLQAWKSWLATLPATSSGYFSVEMGNYSLSKLIYTLSGQNITLFLHVILLGLFIWVLYMTNRSFQKPSVKIYRSIKKERELKDAFLVAGFGILTMLLASGLVWAHYYILTIPLYLFFLRPQIENNFISKTHFLSKPLTYMTLALLSQIITKQFPSQTCAINSNILTFTLLVLLIIEILKEK